MGVHKTEVYPEIKKLLDIPEDEPIFILRAQDKAALPTLIDYEDEADHKGASDEFYNSLEPIYEDFRKWQADNPDKVKVPD
jgi:hypothetical protein